MGKKPGNAPLQRLAAGPRKNRSGLRPDRAHQREVLRRCIQHGRLGPVVEPLDRSVAVEEIPRRADQCFIPGIGRVHRPAAVQQAIQVFQHGDPAAKGGRAVAGGPVALHPCPHLRRAEPALLVQHQVDAQRVVGLPGIARGNRAFEHRFDPAHQVRHQQVVLQPDVGPHRSIEDRWHAVEAVAPCQRRIGQRQAGIGRQVTRGRQHLGHRARLRSLVEGGDGSGQRPGFLPHRLQVGAVVAIAGIERCGQPQEDHHGQRVAEQPQQAEAEFPAQVRLHQVGFGHDHALEDVLQEIAAMACQLRRRGIGNGFLRGRKGVLRRFRSVGLVALQAPEHGFVVRHHR
ncbi:hypothetical protein D9M72_295490 [compost metagenome]